MPRRGWELSGQSPESSSIFLNDIHHFLSRPSRPCEQLELKWASGQVPSVSYLMGIWEEIKFLYSTGWPRTALRQAASDCEVAKCPIPVLGSSRRWWWESVKLGVFRGAGVFLGQILLNNFSKGIFHPHCIMWNRRPSGQNRLLSGAPLGFCNCWLHMSLIGS